MAKGEYNDYFDEDSNSSPAEEQEPQKEETAEEIEAREIEGQTIGKRNGSKLRRAIAALVAVAAANHRQAQWQQAAPCHSSIGGGGSRGGSRVDCRSILAAIRQRGAAARRNSGRAARRAYLQDIRGADGDRRAACRHRARVSARFLILGRRRLSGPRLDGTAIHRPTRHTHLQGIPWHTALAGQFQENSHRLQGGIISHTQGEKNMAHSAIKVLCHALYIQKYGCIKIQCAFS